MMKEVCAQCLQPQIDPVTGERTVVFSCFNQDQALDRVDFPALHHGPVAVSSAHSAFYRNDASSDQVFLLASTARSVGRQHPSAASA